MQTTRRHFLRHSAAVSAGFFGLSQHVNAARSQDPTPIYGALQKDPHRIIDLPKGFSYRVLSRTGDMMDDGFTVPGMADGMAAFPGQDGRVILVRNHELGTQYDLGPYPFAKGKVPSSLDPALNYDGGDKPFVGGTTNVVYNPKTGEVEKQFLSLTGTDRNCAGGPTPWGSWVTCEEPGDLTSKRGQKHGYCFEVDATDEAAVQKPIPLKGLGRFRHEAIAVHPATGIVYLTEDRNDGLIYRFIPSQPGNLQAGGKLQALKIKGRPSAVTRNWEEDEQKMPVGKRVEVEWMDLEDIEAPNDDLRFRGFEAGAARFSRGEGMWYGDRYQVSEDSIYWACTDGGSRRQGQIFRYYPSASEGTAGESATPGHLELAMEPDDSKLLENGDNICVAEWGDVMICEDSSITNAIRGVTLDGSFYTFARNVVNSSELAGVCFSPDFMTMFVNIQKPGITLAITGPWRSGRLA